MGRHFGFHQTLARLRSDFSWAGMRQTVRDFLRHCDVCQRNKSDHMAPAELLQPLPVPNRIWSEISMDFVKGLPPSGGYQVIMVMVDRLSKYAHFIPLSHPFSAMIIAKAFISYIVGLHDIPTSIVSDRDKIFEWFLESSVSVAGHQIANEFQLSPPNGRTNRSR